MDSTTVTPSRLPGPAFIPFAFPGVPNVGCVFCTGLAGTLAIGQVPGDTDQVVANRQRLLASFSLPRWVELRQVHKDGMAVNPAATSLHERSSLEADGSCTAEKQLALLIKTADCQPILLTNSGGTAVAALHAGWRGNAMNFPAAAVARFCKTYATEPRDVLAVRGPSLGPAAAEFINFEKEWSPEFRPWFNEQRRTMDLWRLTRHQLTQAGVLPEHIFGLDLCTHSLHDVFFSHRRGHLGRQGSLIWIT